MKNICFSAVLCTFVLSAFTSCEDGSKPTANFTYEVNGNTVQFTNTSTNTTEYSWNFGDGKSSTSTNPSHTYRYEGTYNVLLRATGHSNFDICEHTVTISKEIKPETDKPTANFNYTPSSPKAGQTVKFTNTSQNASYYNWDFGNNKTSTQKEPTMVFGAGMWTVRLTVYNSDRTYQHEISKTINVSTEPTTVRLTSYTVNSIDFEDENGRYWDDSSKDGPDIYMRIYEGEKEIHRSEYRKDNVTASDLPFTNNLGFTLDDLYKTYTMKLCDYDPMLVDYMFSFTFTPSNFTDEYPTTVYARNGKFDIELHLEWK